MSQRSLIPLFSSANFVIGMGAFMVIGMMEPMADGLDLTTAEAGWVMTWYALAYAIGSPLLVALSGAMSRRLVISGGMLTFGIAAALAALVPVAEVVFSARFLAALGAGLVTPLAAAIVAAQSAEETRGRALASVFFGLTLAQVMGVPVGSFLAYTFGWQVSFACVAVLALPMAWLLYSRIPADLSFPVNRLGTLWSVLKDWRLMMAISFTATFLAANYVVYTYLTPLLSTTMGFERNGITFVLLIFGFGAVFGNLMGGWLTDRIGPPRTLMLLAVSQLVLLPVFSALPIPVPLLYLLTFLISICGWSFMAAQQARLVRLSPQKANVMLALNAAAIYVGAAVGSAIGGAVLSAPALGLNALGIVGALTVTSAIATLIFSRPARPPLN